MQAVTDDNPTAVQPIAVSQETAARMLEVTSQTIRNWEKDGKLVAVKIGKLKRFRVADLRRLVGAEGDAAGEIRPKE
jgi:excisionase family DNA binding protein